MRTNSIVHPRIDSDAELRADAVRTADEQGVGVARRPEIKHAAESTNFGARTRATR